MKTNMKLIALISAILIALAFPVASVLAVVAPDGSYCLDKVGVISNETKTYIYERNKNLEQNCRGAQMCVVVLDSINGDDIEEYAYDIFKLWKIGRKGEDNGVLMLMLTKDDDYWIMPGSGLENEVLTGAMLSSTINTYCEPSFAKKDYDTAVRKTFERLNDEICSYYRANPNGIADPSLINNEDFVGGGSGNGPSNHSNQDFSSAITSSCNSLDIFASLRPSCASFHVLRGCASCAIACGSCAGCGGGFGGLVLAFVVIYAIVQVLKYLGQISRMNGAGAGRASTTIHSSRRRTHSSYSPFFGGVRFRPGRNGTYHTTYTTANRSQGTNSYSGRSNSNAASSSGGKKSNDFSSFFGGGGNTRGGGTGRSYANRSGSTSRGGGSFDGSFKGFSGGSPFKGGGGGTRGGGAGRKK